MLEGNIVKGCHDRNLDPDEAFRLKVTQLDELLGVRHCICIMGPPAAGKSECWRTLMAARNYMDGMKTTMTDLSPKTCPTADLYGYTTGSGEWKDGVISKIMRDLGNIPDELPKWIMLDGDLDANWIESMNSVMDDNKMLTLPSNERIPLKAHMKMIFEIRDLKYATPATVSRVGILYISADVGQQWESMIKVWIKGGPKFGGDAYNKYSDEQVTVVLVWVCVLTVGWV